MISPGSFMGQLLVRQIRDELIEKMRQRAAANGRSVEAEHRASARTARRRSGSKGKPGTIAREMKHAVIDASVAVKWVVEEEFSDAAERLLTAGTTMHVPAHWLAEATNAVTAYCVFRHLLSAEDTREKVAFLADTSIREHRLRDLSRSATDIALELGATTCDTLYLALAVELNAPFVTADRKLYERIKVDGRWLSHLCWVANIPEW
jgi:predicted nucleic acid-binding protein